MDNLQEEQSSQNYRIFLLSLIISSYFSLVYYPGIYYSGDSYVRWDLAFQILHPKGEYPTPFTILPAIWMAFTYWITQNFGAFAFLQSFLFFYSSLTLIRVMGNFKGLWMWLPIFIFSNFCIFQYSSVYFENSIGTVIAINFMLILCSQKHVQMTALKQGMFAVVYFLVFSALFGFRQNTVTILPVVFFILWRGNKHKELFRIQALTLILALVFVLALPQLMADYRSIPKRNQLSLALAWETAQIIKKLNDPKYDHYLDYAGYSDQSTRNVLHSELHFGTWAGMLFPNGLSYKKLIQPDVAEQVKKGYIRIIKEHPKEFLENKLQNCSYMLGIPEPLRVWEFGKEIRSQIVPPSFKYTPLRDQQFKRIEYIMEHYSFIRRPFIVFLIGFLFFIAGLVFFKDVRLLGSVFCLGIFYHVGFLLVTENYVFRHSFPAFYLNSIIVLVVVTKFLETQIGFLKQKFIKGIR
jgi:hypothetical protein